MEHVLTRQPNAGLCTQRFRPTYVAKVINSTVVRDLHHTLVVKILPALVLQARQTLLLTRKAVAGVATRVHLVARLLHESLAFSLQANVLEAGQRTRGFVFHLVLAEAAFPSNFIVSGLVARHSHVVGSAFALGTEVLLAGAAPNSKISHVLSSFAADVISFVVFLLVVRPGRF